MIWQENKDQNVWKKKEGFRMNPASPGMVNGSWAKAYTYIF